MKRATFHKELAETGSARVNTPALFEYFHEKAAVACRDWTCSMCRSQIKRGQPFLRTTMGDHQRQEQFHTCWPCVIVEELGNELPYTKMHMPVQS